MRNQATQTMLHFVGVVGLLMTTTPLVGQQPDSSRTDNPAPMAQSELIRELVRVGPEQTPLIQEAQTRCIQFGLTPDLLDEFRQLGATPKLVQALKNCRPWPETASDSDPTTPQTGRGARLHIQVDTTLATMAAWRVQVLSDGKPREGVIVVAEPTLDGKTRPPKARRTDSQGWARFEQTRPASVQTLEVRISAPRLPIPPQILTLGSEKSGDRPKNLPDARLVAQWTDSLPSGQTISILSLALSTAPDDSVSGKPWLEIQGQRMYPWRDHRATTGRVWFQFPADRLRQVESLTVGMGEYSLGQLQPPWKPGPVQLAEAASGSPETGWAQNNDSARPNLALPTAGLADRDTTVQKNEPPTPREGAGETASSSVQHTSDVDHPDRDFTILMMSSDMGGQARPARIQPLPQNKVRILFEADQIPFTLPSNTQTLSVQINPSTRWPATRTPEGGLKIEGPRSELSAGDVLALQEGTNVLGRMVVYRASQASLP